MVIHHIAQDGINHRKDKVSVSTCNNIPIPIFGVPTSLQDDFLTPYNSEPIIAALYSELDNSADRQSSAFTALLRYTEALGESQFKQISKGCSTEREQNLYTMIKRQHEGSDGGRAYGTNEKISGRQPPDGVSFGVVPNTIINKLGKLMLWNVYFQEGLNLISFVKLVLDNIYTIIKIYL